MPDFSPHIKYAIFDNIIEPKGNHQSHNIGPIFSAAGLARSERGEQCGQVKLSGGDVVDHQNSK